MRPRRLPFGHFAGTIALPAFPTRPYLPPPNPELLLMRRLAFSALIACAFVAVSGLRATAQEWATIKGQVVFPKDKEIPKRAPLNVTQDKDHCLSKGELLDESVVVNAKNRGVKNVVVFLRPDDT